MHLHAKPRKLITMQPPLRIISNLPHIPRLQSPHRASRHRRRHLPSRQHVRRPKRHLRPPLRILRHRNNRVRSIQPHPNQIHSRLVLHPTSISKILSSQSLLAGHHGNKKMSFRAKLGICVAMPHHYFPTSSPTETPLSSQSPPHKQSASQHSPPSTPPPPPN